MRREKLVRQGGVAAATTTPAEEEEEALDGASCEREREREVCGGGMGMGSSAMYGPVSLDCDHHQVIISN